MQSKEPQNCHHHPVRLHGRMCGRMDGSQKGAEIPCSRKSCLTDHFVLTFVPGSRINASCRQTSECFKIPADSVLLPSSSKWKPTWQLNLGSQKWPRDSESQINEKQQTKNLTPKNNPCVQTSRSEEDICVHAKNTNMFPEVSQPRAVIGEDYYQLSKPAIVLTAQQVLSSQN